MARKVFHKEVINCIVQKFGEQTNYNKFFKEFIEKFPRKKDFDNEERDNGISGKAWYPEGELWMLRELFGINFEKETEGLTTEHWCDFYNELCENNW